MASENKIKNVILNILKENEETRDQMSSLLLGISKNTGVLAEMNEVLEPLVGGFLFDKDKQLNIVLNDGEPDLSLTETETLPQLNSEVIKLDSQIMENPVLFTNDNLSVNSPGDIEVHSIFERRRVEDRKRTAHKVNELETCFTIAGFPSMDMIATVVTDLLREGAVKDFGLNTKDVHAALSELLPCTTTVLDDIVDLKMSQFHFEEGDGFVKCCIEGDFNMKGLKETYPSLHKILGHIQHLNLDLLEVGDAYPTPPQSSAEDKEFLQFVKEANRGFELILDNHNGIPSFTLNWTINQDGDTLLWNDSAGNPLPGKLLGFDIHSAHRFFVSLNYSIRIKELGCTSLSLPGVVLNMQYNPIKEGVSDECTDYASKPGFHLEMFFFEKQSLISRILVRPFINMNLLRELMQIRFFVHMGIEKSKEERDQGGDSQLNLNFRAALLPPPIVLSSCLKVFVKQHLSNQGDLLLYKNITGALGEDLRNLAQV